MEIRGYGTMIVNIVTNDVLFEFYLCLLISKSYNIMMANRLLRDL